MNALAQHRPQMASVLGWLLTATLAAPGVHAQLPPAASQVGPAETFQASLRLSPNLEVNLATGNLHVSVLTSRFGGTGREPFHELYLYHNSLGAPEVGDVSGGLGLGNGWSSAVGGRLQFPTPQTAHLAFPGGASRTLSKLSPTLWRSEIGRELEVGSSGSGWIATDADQWSWHYDSTGALVQVSDPSCNDYATVERPQATPSSADPGRWDRWRGERSPRLRASPTSARALRGPGRVAEAFPRRLPVVSSTSPH